MKKNHFTYIAILFMITFNLSFTSIVPIYAETTLQHSNENVPSEVEGREILRGSSTKTVTYAGNKAKITVYYTYRYESSNASGKYITGFTGASISKVSGWYSVGTVTINMNGIIYSRNSQVASVPVTYTAGMGEGNNTTCSATLTVSLL